MSDGKMWTRYVEDFVATSVIFSIISVSPAYAYVDPGSGSVIVTTILGMIAAVGYMGRKYFYKFRRLISGDKKIKDRKQEETAPQDGNET